MLILGALEEGREWLHGAIYINVFDPVQGFGHQSGCLKATTEEKVVEQFWGRRNRARETNRSSSDSEFSVTAANTDGRLAAEVLKRANIKYSVPCV